MAAGSVGTPGAVASRPNAQRFIVARYHQHIMYNDATMRTTLTIDPDVRLLLDRRMRERGLSFKEAVNGALRDSLAESGGRARFHTPTFDLGEPLVPLDKALRLAGELEDEELLRRLAARK